MIEMLQSLRKRLKRRNLLLDEVRSAYLKDVIVLRELLRKNEPPHDGQSSLNLRPTLALYAPPECAFRIANSGADSYGGHLEVIHQESNRAMELSKCIEQLLEVEQNSRLQVAKSELSAQRDRIALMNQHVLNRNEREHLCSEIHKLKDRLDDIDESENQALRRSMCGLRRRLYQAECHSHHLLQLVNSNMRSQEEAGRMTLQLISQERRVSKLESELLGCKLSLSRSLGRSEEMEIKLTDELKRSSLLQRKVNDISLQLKHQLNRFEEAQNILQESRRSETEICQKLNDLRVEYTEAIQREEAEQEEMQLLLEQVTAREKVLKKEIDEIASASRTLEQDHQLVLVKLQNEMKEKLNSERTNAVQQLQDTILKHEDRFSKVEAKLKLQQDKRAFLEVELHSARAECEKHGEVDKSNETLLNIISLFEICPGISRDIGIDDDLPEFVLERVTELVDLLNKIMEANSNLEAELEHCKSNPNLTTSDSEGGYTIKKDQESVEALAGALSQMQSQLDIVKADKLRMESEACLMATAVEQSRFESNQSRDRIAAAMVSFRAEILNEIDLAQSFVQPKSSVRLLEDSTSRIARVENKVNEIYSDAGDLLDRCNSNRSIEQEQKHNKRNDYHDSTLQRGSVLESSTSAQETKTDRLISLIVSTLHQICGIGSQMIADETAKADLDAFLHEKLTQLNTGDFNNSLEDISSRLSDALGAISAELLSTRATLKKKTEGPSHPGMAERITDLEHESVGAGDRNTLTKNGREDEVQRLKQRNAAQQNFILELQEKLATMKSLMFAADETKRQCNELEEKYRLLENEFTKKAESEVSARKAKQRIELQLTVASADIASLSRGRKILTDSLSESSRVLASLESKFAHVQGNYKDLMQREQLRLETNRDIQIQFNPMLSDADVQTAFVTSGSSLRQMNSHYHIPHRRHGPEVITPVAPVLVKKSTYSIG